MNAKKALDENGNERQTEDRFSLRRRGGVWRLAVDAELTWWSWAKITGGLSMFYAAIWKLMQLISEAQQ